MGVAAQEQHKPLYFTADGVLYQWDISTSEPQAISSDGYIDTLVHAPSGDLIAFVWHQTEVDTVNSYYGFSEQFDGDHLYVIESDEPRKLYEFSGILPPPTWSSDASKLVWTQGSIIQRDDGYSDLETGVLRYYDFEQTQVYGEEVFGDRNYFSGGDGGEHYLAQPTWAGSYITFQFPYAGPETMLKLETTRYGDEAQRILVSNFVYSGNVQIFDVTTDKGQYIGLFYERYGQWDLVNPLTLESQALDNAVVEAYNPNAPDTSFSWRIAPILENAIDQTWQLYQSDENLRELVSSSWQPFTFSADGTATAYFDETGIYVIQEDGSTSSLPIDGVTSIAWGAVQWHVADNVTVAKSEQPYYFDKPSCDKSVQIGDEAITISGNVEFYSHSRPLRYIRYYLTKGTPLHVVGNPICRDAREQRIVFWQVEAYGKVGWVAESAFSVISND